MSSGERIALAQEILDSVVDGDERLNDAKRSELRSRLEHHRSNPDDLIPWERIKAEAHARFRK